MNILISGGCKNGKSYYAQKLALSMAQERSLPLYYLATMIPHDEEDRSRIARHVASRSGLGFQTIECGLGLEAALQDADVEGTYLLDSVTALLSNEMFRPDDSIDLTAPERVARELTALARRMKSTVIDSDYVPSDARH